MGTRKGTREKGWRMDVTGALRMVLDFEAAYIGRVTVTH